MRISTVIGYAVLNRLELSVVVSVETIDLKQLVITKVNPEFRFNYVTAKLKENSYRVFKLTGYLRSPTFQPVLEVI